MVLSGRLICRNCTRNSCGIFSLSFFSPPIAGQPYWITTRCRPYLRLPGYVHRTETRTCTGRAHQLFQRMCRFCPHFHTTACEGTCVYIYVCVCVCNIILINLKYIPHYYHCELYPSSRHFCYRSFTPTLMSPLIYADYPPSPCPSP